jgi:hypothetical protein
MANIILTVTEEDVSDFYSSYHTRLHRYLSHVRPFQLFSFMIRICNGHSSWDNTGWVSNLKTTLFIYIFSFNCFGFGSN